MSAGAAPILTDLVPFEEGPEEPASPTAAFDSASRDYVFEHNVDSKGNCLNLDTIFANISRVNMNKYSVVNDSDPDIKTAQAILSELKFSDPSEDFAFGAVMGLCIGDALGAPLEFTACRSDMRKICARNSLVLFPTALDRAQYVYTHRHLSPRL
jgi:hypothetical protein